MAQARLQRKTTGKSPAQETGGADRVRPSWTLEQKSLYQHQQRIPEEQTYGQSQAQMTNVQIKGTHTFMLLGFSSSLHPQRLPHSPEAQDCSFVRNKIGPTLRDIQKENFKSQKNGNQLSAFFPSREKTFPMGSRLWLGGKEGRPGAQALGKHRKGPCQALGLRQIQPLGCRT